MTVKTDARPVILAVDDMGINLRAMKMALEKDFDVRLAKSGALALSIVQKQKIDLILLDIEMPEMSGFEFMRRMKDIPLMVTPPVIFVTAHASPELLARAKIMGVMSYVIKPFEPAVLRKKVDEALLPVHTAKENPAG